MTLANAIIVLLAATTVARGLRVYLSQVAGGTGRLDGRALVVEAKIQSQVVLHITVVTLYNV